MSEHIGFRVTKEAKEYMNSTLSEIPDLYPDVSNKGEALKKIFDIYNERLEFTDDDNTILDTEIQNVLNKIDCDFLSYESQALGFMCNEFFFRKKKGDSVGYDPRLVLTRCNDCAKGKEKQKEIDIEKMLQKDSIKKILDLRKALMTMIGKGFDVEACLCKGDMIDQNAVYFSMDGKHLPCPIADDESLDMPLVSIADVCLEAINPTTYKTPCEHFINLYHKVFIPDFVDIVKEVQKDLPQIEQQESPKIIDADVTIISEDSNDDDKGGVLEQ